MSPGLSLRGEMDTWHGGRWSFRKDGTGRQELAGGLRGCMGIAKKMDLAWRTAQLGTGGCGKGDRMKVKVR